MKNYLTDQQKILVEFASKDETRLALNGIFQDSKSDFQVSTDGHRLMAVKGIIESFKDKILDADCFKDGKMLAIDEGHFPNWMPLIPTTFTHCIKLRLPEWLKHQKNSKPQREKLTLTFEFCETTTGEIEPRIVVAGFCEGLSVDSTLLAPMAGMEVTMLLGDKTSPIVILPSEANTKDLFNNDWLAVVMPIRTSANDNVIKLIKLD